jgi:nucleoside-diphosphate-sugar epimerase
MSLVKRTFTWEPRYSLEEGIKELLSAPRQEVS